MPVKITKGKNGCYKVSTPNMVHAKCASMDNAMKQARLLRGLEHGMKLKKVKK